MKEKKIKWTTKYSIDFKRIRDFLDELLKNNGVDYDDEEDFLLPTSKNLKDPFDMINMDKAVECVHRNIKKEAPNILVRVDPDVDGFTSASMVVDFISKLNENATITYLLNFEKKHGLRYVDVCNYPGDAFDLIIIPDASMELKDAIDISNNFSAEIVVLDHHLISEEDNSDSYLNYCIGVNCTDGSYPNPHLCGAGVVQKFIEGYIKTYGETDHLDTSLVRKYYDLVSLAHISDGMDLRSKESRFYAVEGTKPRYYNNEFINELVAKKEAEMPFGRYIGSMGWKIGPLINGVIRYGEEKDQVDMFRAMCGEREDRVYQPRRKHADDPKPPAEIRTLQKEMARIAFNIKTNQDKMVRGYFKSVIEKITGDKGDKNSIIFVDATDIVDKKTVTGLMANKVASEYFRPAVILKSANSQYYGGSMRGSVYSNITDVKSALESCGVEVAG